MGIGDKIKRFITGEDDDYEGDTTEQTEEEEVETPAGRHERSSGYTKQEAKTAPRNPSGQPKVVDIHTTAKLQVVLRKPEHFDEQKSIADDLLEKRTVVLNLEDAPRDDASKLLCFLSGVAYANDGNLKKIANNTYIITPYNVDVMGDLLDELENNGMFFI